MFIYTPSSPSVPYTITSFAVSTHLMPSPQQPINMTFIFSFLMLSTVVTASTGLTTLFRTPTTTSDPRKSNPIDPRANLAPRCDNPPCVGGTDVFTSEPATVTEYVNTVVTVPCTTSVYVSNDVTMTSTYYSSETITSTLVEEKTIYIFQYSPTPVVESAVYTTTYGITAAVTSVWEETSGSVYDVTSTGGTATWGGGGGSGWGDSMDDPTPSPAATHDGCNDCNDVDVNGWSGDAMASGTGPTPAAQQDGAAVQTVSSQNAAAPPADGWSTAAGTAAGPTATPSNIATTMYSASGANVQFNAASQLASTRLGSSVGGVVVGMMVMLAAEYAFV